MNKSAASILANGPLGALLCAALIGRRGGEKPTTPAEWREAKMKQLQNEIEVRKIGLKLLEQGSREGKSLVDIQTGAVTIKGETSFHTIATYADEGLVEVSVVYTDSRKSGTEKVYNAHGLHAATAIAESIEESVTEEAMAAAEEEAAEKEAKEKATTTPAAEGTEGTAQ